MSRPKVQERFVPIKIVEQQAARTIWAMLISGETYRRPEAAPAAA